MAELSEPVDSFVRTFVWNYHKSRGATDDRAMEAVKQEVAALQYPVASSEAPTVEIDVEHRIIDDPTPHPPVDAANLRVGAAASGDDELTEAYLAGFANARGEECVADLADTEDYHVAHISAEAYLRGLTRAQPLGGDELERLKVALVQAAVPLEGLLASREWVSLANESWAEIENGVMHIRAALTSQSNRALEEEMACAKGNLMFALPQHASKLTAPLRRR